MKGVNIFVGFIQCCVRYPIWFFLVYTVLTTIHPDRLIWFLFWVYVSLGVLTAWIQTAIEVVEKNDSKK